MSRDDYLIQVYIMSPETRTLDAGGGWTYADPPSPATYWATKHTRSTQDAYDREKQASGGVEGPGVLTKWKAFFTFTESLPTVAINDHIVEVATGTRWKVLNFRTWNNRLQVDVDQTLNNQMIGN